MKKTKVMLSVIALAALLGSALLTLPSVHVFAQSAPDITGTWQGALQLPQGRGELRTVIKISKADGGGLKAMFYSIDQQGPGIAVGTISVQGSTVKFAIPGIGGSYEGKLDSDGVNLTGNFTQGPNPLPLNLKHVSDAAAWEIPKPPPPLKPMAADANPVFEVATIKPSRPEAQGRGFAIRGREFSTFNTTLSSIITFAYGLHARQIVGGPAWMESEKYDITAKPDGEGQPSQQQWKIMVQKLMADRFKLTFHHEKKELSVFALMVGKSGPKLTRNESNPNGLPGLFFRGLGNLPARNATMADFAGTMQGAVLDRPVVDQPGLPGRWDFELKWTPDESQFSTLGGYKPPATEPADAPPDLFTAIQQQLGLKLESTKAPVDVMVIDNVEKLPTSRR